MTAAGGTLDRWRSEKTAAFLSSAVAASEPDPAKAALFKDMAAAAEDQAGRSRSMRARAVRQSMQLSWKPPCRGPHCSRK